LERQGRLPLATVAVLAATLVLAPAPACAAGGLTGADAMTATVFQEGQSSFSGLGLRFRLQDPRLMESIEILPTVEYWRNSSSIDSYGLRTVRRDATLAADLRWLFPGDSWRLYAGGGVAVHFLSNEVNAPGLGVTDANDSFTKGGFTLLAGATFGTRSRLGNFIEAKGHLVGGYRQLKVNLGLCWNR
jgi:hypothetical protein